MPRAKCDLRKDDENHTELIVDHQGVQYRAICPMDRNERAKLVDDAGVTILSQPQFDEFSSRDDICGLPFEDGGFLAAGDERSGAALTQAGPNFLVCPIAHKQKSKDNVFLLPDGTKLHVNCRAFNSEPSTHIARGDTQRPTKYKHFEDEPLPGFGKSLAELASDPEDSFFSKDDDYFKREEPAQYGESKKAFAALASAVGIASALEASEPKNRVFLDTTDMCTRPKKNELGDLQDFWKKAQKTALHEKIPGKLFLDTFGDEPNQLFDKAIKTLFDARSANMDEQTSEGYFDDTLRERICQCNKSFVKMGWDPNSPSKQVDFERAKARLDTPEKRIEFVQNALECWAPDKAVVLNASDAQGVWGEYARSNRMQSRQKTNSRTPAEKKTSYLPGGLVLATSVASRATQHGSEFIDNSDEGTIQNRHNEIRLDLPLLARHTQPQSNEFFGVKMTGNAFNNNVATPWVSKQPESEFRSRGDMFLDTRSGFMSGSITGINFNATMRGAYGLPSGFTRSSFIKSAIDTNHTDRGVMDRIVRPLDPFTGKTLFDPENFDVSVVEANYCAFVPKSRVFYREFEHKKVSDACLRAASFISPDLSKPGAYIKGPKRGRVKNPLKSSTVKTVKEARKLCDTTEGCYGFSIDATCPENVNQTNATCSVNLMSSLAQMDQSELSERFGDTVFAKTGIVASQEEAQTVCDRDPLCSAFTYDKRKQEATGFFRMNHPRPQGVTDGTRGPTESCVVDQVGTSLFEVDYEKAQHPKLFTDPLCRLKLQKAQESEENFENFLNNEHALGRRAFSSCLSFTRTPKVPGSWLERDNEEKDRMRARCTSLTKAGCEKQEFCQFHPAMSSTNNSTESFCDLRRTLKHLDPTIEGSQENECISFVQNDPTGGGKGRFTAALIQKFQSSEKNLHLREVGCSARSATESTSAEDFVTDAAKGFACTKRSCIKEGEALVTREIIDANCPINICQQTIEIQNVTIVGDGNELNLSQGCSQTLEKINPGEKCGEPWAEFLKKKAKGRATDDDRAQAIEACVRKIESEFRTLHKIPKTCKLAVNLPPGDLDESQSKPIEGSACSSSSAWEACVLPNQEGCPQNLTSNFKSKCEETLARLSNTAPKSYTETVATSCNAADKYDEGGKLCKLKNTNHPCIDSSPATSAAFTEVIGSIAFSCYPGVDFPIGLNDSGVGVCLSEDGARCGKQNTMCKDFLLQSKVTAPKQLKCAAKATGTDNLNLNFGTTKGWCSQIMYQSEKGQNLLPSGIKSYFDSLEKTCTRSDFFKAAVTGDLCEKLGTESLQPLKDVSKLDNEIDRYLVKSGVKDAKCLRLNVNKAEEGSLNFLFHLTGDDDCLQGQNENLNLAPERFSKSAALSSSSAEIAQPSQEKESNLLYYLLGGGALLLLVAVGFFFLRRRSQ